MAQTDLLLDLERVKSVWLRLRLRRRVGERFVLRRWVVGRYLNSPGHWEPFESLRALNYDLAVLDAVRRYPDLMIDVLPES